MHFVLFFAFSQFPFHDSFDFSFVFRSFIHVLWKMTETYGEISVNKRETLPPMRFDLSSGFFAPNTNYVSRWPSLFAKTEKAFNVAIRVDSGYCLSV